MQEVSVDDKLCDSKEKGWLFMQCESPEPPPLMPAIKPSKRKLGFL